MSRLRPFHHSPGVNRRRSLPLLPNRAEHQYLMLDHQYFPGLARMRAVNRLLLTSVASAAALGTWQIAAAANERIASTSEIRIDLPEATSPPLISGIGSPGLRLELPDPPGAVVVIDRKELVGLAVPEPKIEVAVPEPPPAAIVIRPDEPAPPAQSIEPFPGPPAEPQGPILAIVPLQPPNVAPPEKPAEAKQPAASSVAAIPRDVLRAAIQRLKAGKRITDAEAEDALAFYGARDFAPLWQDGQGWNARAKQVRERLSLARDDGLDPARYRSVSTFVQPGEPNWFALAAAEAQLTESVILYAREAAIGRVRPALVHEFITPQLKTPAAGAILKALGEATDANLALQGFHPPHAGYRALRQALKAARDRAQATFVGDPIPEGAPLRVGMRDPRVPLIRARLGLGYNASPLYDRQISIRMAAIQRGNGLPANGIFTPATAKLLSGERPTAEEAEIIANMERWRWLPRELGRDHIWVNAPEQRIEMIRSGSVIHTATAIIGTLETQTPVFSDEMDHIVVNPSWFVPPGILKKEPKYLNDAYAEARGYTIRRRGETVTVRVPPGPTNPLGYVKFMFPNDHAVYLHDTPKRGLFNARVRTLSNGCVRVQDPFVLAAKIFEDDGWTAERFKKLIGGAEQRMNLPRKLPIHLTYFTMTVDEAGTLQKHPDFYGHSAKLRQLLGLS
jgi:L,D-transpeptidase YcbB